MFITRFERSEGSKCLRSNLFEIEEKYRKDKSNRKRNPRRTKEFENFRPNLRKNNEQELEEDYKQRPMKSLPTKNDKKMFEDR